MPADSVPTLKVLISALARLEAEIRTLDAEIARRAKENDVALRLMTAPGIGPLIATAIAPLAPPPETFRKGRDFAAWLGLVPRQHSTGGKQRLGATTKMAERSLRRLLIIGAKSVIIKRHVHAAAKPGTWLGGMLTRKPPSHVRVALANIPLTHAAHVLSGNGWRGSSGRLWPGVASTSLRPRRHKPTVGREDVGAQEGKERFGATVVRRDRENQCSTECLRARGVDLDLIFEHHTGPRHLERRSLRPDICQHPTTRHDSFKIPLVLGAVTYVAQTP